jgi:hypothetical protein
MFSYEQHINKNYCAVCNDMQYDARVYWDESQEHGVNILIENRSRNKVGGHDASAHGLFLLCGQQAETLLDRQTFARVLVLGRESSRMRRLRLIACKRNSRENSEKNTDTSQNFTQQKLKSSMTTRRSDKPCVSYFFIVYTRLPSASK